MSAPTRRAVLGATTAAILAAAPAAAFGSIAAQNPDAELIRVCAQHVINMDALNSVEGWNEGGPVWTDYDEIRDFITDAQPQTLAGVLAMARAARREATDLDGEERWSGSMGEAWAPEIINHMLRIAGGASIGGAT